MKFVVDRAYIEQDIAVYKTWKFVRDVWIAGHIVWTSIYFLENFKVFEWLYVVQYRPDKYQT